MRRFRIFSAPLALVCVAVLLAPAAHAGEKGQVVTMSQELEFAETSGASGKVQSECTLQTRLPQFIKDYAKGVKVVLAEEVSDSTEGKVLHVEIVNVVGTSGGAWSGAKSVTVKGELTEDGEVIGTFIASRYSGGGAFAGMKGTCSILGRCIKAIGSDIGKWLTKPTMDAALGDA